LARDNPDALGRCRSATESGHFGLRTDHQLDCTSTLGESRSGSERQLEELRMAWKTPKIVELALGAEINCYACAELN
jgi:coenzyme PQQ precursor peptide PqqA